MLLLQVFTQVLLPICVVIAIGWVLDRRFNLELNTLVKLNISLFVPAFVFVRIVESNISGAMAVRVIVFTMSMIACMFVLGEIIGRLNRYRTPEKRALQIAAMFYNSGNYGVPLMTLAYPALGPVLQVFVILVQNLSNFTIGLFLVAPAGESRTRRLFYTLRQVSVWAVALGIVTRQLGLPVQQWSWLWVPLQYLAAGLVAIALVTLGAQLSKTSHHQPWRRLSWALGLRLIAGPAVAFALVPIFGFKGRSRCRHGAQQLVSDRGEHRPDRPRVQSRFPLRRRRGVLFDPIECDHRHAADRSAPRHLSWLKELHPISSTQEVWT